MFKKVIYNETQQQFFRDVLSNIFIDKMKRGASELDIHASISEINSWNNNAPRIKNLLELSNVDDTYVTFEYFVPYNRKRIDCMIYGKGINNEKNVVHIELKQWTNNSVKISKSEGNFNVEEIENDGQYVLQAFTGGNFRVVPHPSQQVEGYNNYLLNFIDVLSSHELKIKGMAYCYNYRKNTTDSKVLFDTKYNEIQSKYRTYSGDEISELAKVLHNILCNGDGFSIFNKMIQSPIKPSKKLLESASEMIINNKNAFSLIEEQIVARNTILDKIQKINKNKKSVIIVKGGPGTGKTVIALNILATLAKGKYKVHFATKSKPLLEGIKDRFPRNSDTKLLFSNVHQFLPCSMDENQLDVLLIDEAHRISKSANSQYDKKNQRTSLTQIETIIRASKITVFFIDDKQAVRNQEIGSSSYIKACAIRNNAFIEEVELISQFRCNGSNNYLDWLEQVLYNEKVINKASFTKEEYDFRIFDTPTELYNAIVEKNSKDKMTARLTAGFCWEWSKKLDSNGDLKKDVKIGDFAMPWETYDKITKIPKKYVKWFEWAYKPNGINQIGCIYTAQGFEFDYIGVIVGEDLKYSTTNNRIDTDITKTKDPTLNKGKDKFDTYVRNIYRVLMSRGMKGCYVYFCDENLKKYFQQKLKDMNYN